VSKATRNKQLCGPDLRLASDSPAQAPARRTSFLFRAVIAIAIARLSASEKAVLVALLSFTDFETGESWPSLNSLADRAGLSRRGLVNNLKAVTNRRFVIVRKRFKGDGLSDSNLYVLNVGELERASLPGALGAPPPSAIDALGVVQPLHRGSALGAHDRDQLTQPQERAAAPAPGAAVGRNRPARRVRPESPATPSTPAHAPVTPKKIDDSSNHSPSFSTWSDHWCKEWQGCHGAKYRFAGKDGVALAGIRDHLEDDFGSFRGVVAKYLADTEEFVADKNAHSLTLLNSQLNKYMARPAADAEDSPRTPTPDELAVMFGSPLRAEDATT